MKIQALKLSAIPPNEEFLRCELEFENSQDLEKAKEDSLPIAYLVLKEDLDRFVQFQDVIIDRGVKNKHKGLSEYLLGLRQEKIPIIDGNYDSSRQLQRSIRTLLKRALSQGEQNLYIISAEEKIFNELWKEAGKGKIEQSFKDAGEARRHFYHKTDLDETSSRLLLDLIGYRKEPEELVKRYVGCSVAVQLVRQLILRAANSDDPVLITGDTGTGKELVAREIHRNSERVERAFMPVNCGAIPGELFESELFGHIKGAFTNATSDKKGLWELAGNGTLFLDEIADLRLDHQVKILRALEERKIMPVGGTKYIEVNARVISATNRDVFSMIKEGEFRDDLYYRLRGFLIRTPALRNHPEDIPLLAQTLWRRITGNKSILPQKIISELQSHGWPGNARELKMVLSTLRSLFGIENLGVEHLQAVFFLEGHGTTPKEEVASENELTLHKAECLHQLKKVNEVINATRSTILSVVEAKLTDEKTITSAMTHISFRLSELEMLTRQPLLFHSEFSFSTVYRLKGKIKYFQNLLQEDINKARKYWKEEIADEFTLVISTIFKEVERLLERA
jgi:DNA-binding NtrC family response regulator